MGRCECSRVEISGFEHYGPVRSSGCDGYFMYFTHELPCVIFILFVFACDDDDDWSDDRIVFFIVCSLLF